MTKLTTCSKTNKRNRCLVKSVLYSDFCACLGPLNGETLCPCALARQNKSQIIDGECRQLTFKDTVLYCYKCCFPQAIKDMGKIRCDTTGKMVPCCIKCSCRTMLTKPISECIMTNVRRITRYHVTQTSGSLRHDGSFMCNVQDITPHHSRYLGYIDGTLAQARQALEKALSTDHPEFAYKWDDNGFQLYARTRYITDEVHSKTFKEITSFSLTQESDNSDMSCFNFSLSERQIQGV